MRIAIIGSGIAGSVAARRLCAAHEITVFEADGRPGGHTHTHSIALQGRVWQVDSGFIVFNDWTYPNFIALLDELGVASQPSRMSFSVRCERTGLEYNGTTLNTLFAQRRNLVRPAFLRMLREILRFNREAPALLDDGEGDLPLGSWLGREGYSSEFVERYLVPMGAAIWSADPAQMHAFPARFLVRFLHNHGMLSVDRRPQWRVVAGGSRRYLDRLLAPYRDRVRLGSPVRALRRHSAHVEICTDAAGTEQFDCVFVACHSDQALALLADPSDAERAVLGAIGYQRNDAVLHTDVSVLPRRRLARAAWNYLVPAAAHGRVAVTYDMNILQGLDAPETFCVSLNPGAALDPARVLERMAYDHPVFTPAAVAAQGRRAEVSGVARTFYCGAYWRYGFHEDGVVSAMAALDEFNAWCGREQQPLRRAG